VAGHLERIYVPNHRDNTVWVIDPTTLRVVDRFRVGVNPQHVVPSWNLQVLWVANNAEGRTDGSLTPIDPRTGKPGPSVPVDDPYNMYWSPDGRYAWGIPATCADVPPGTTGVMAVSELAPILETDVRSHP
jgi:YVTN family beta-propeller protein